MSFCIKTTVKLACACVLALSLSSCTTTTHVARPPVVDISAGDIATTPGLIRQGMYHSVAPGETIWRIAQMYDVDVETIKQINRIRNVRDLDIGKRLYIPEAAPRQHVITLYRGRKWKHIIIHHSATDRGNSLEFNKAHIRRGWKGIGYHFTIDNGTCGKDDGQIEVSPRWIKQLDGAHCKAGGMNRNAIGVCLVGNFTKDSVSSKQMASLIYLTNKLRGYYKIPLANIKGHGQVPGAQTECPGARFPWRKFRSRVE